MEVYPKYFRRLLVGNSPQIFPGINRNVENPSTYPLLVQEMEKITQEPEHQASKIAEVIDTSEESLFRDFDLSTFMDHFKLDPLARTLLASAFTHVSRSDLKTKGKIYAFTSALIEPLLIHSRRGYPVQHPRRSNLSPCKCSQRRIRCVALITRYLRR